MPPCGTRRLNWQNRPGDGRSNVRHSPAMLRFRSCAAGSLWRPIGFRSHRRLFRPARSPVGQGDSPVSPWWRPSALPDTNRDPRRQRRLPSSHSRLASLINGGGLRRGQYRPYISTMRASIPSRRPGGRLRVVFRPGWRWTLRAACRVRQPPGRNPQSPHLHLPPPRRRWRRSLMNKKHLMPRHCEPYPGSLRSVRYSRSRRTNLHGLRFRLRTQVRTLPW